MTAEKLEAVSVSTKANVYFDGKCVSHSVTYPDGEKKSVGVIMPSTLTFNTGAAEVMECVSGACEYRLDGTTEWIKSGSGQKFSVAANSKFDIRVEGEPYSYICSFG